MLRAGREFASISFVRKRWEEPISGAFPPGPEFKARTKTVTVAKGIMRMWQLRNRELSVIGRTGVRSALAVVALTGCVPEAPGGADDPVGPGIQDPEAGYSVQLRWLPPETDAEGGPLGDLDGFRLYFAPATQPLMEEGSSIEVGLDAEGMVTGLSAGAWQFAVTAIDTAGNESTPSEAIEVEVGAR